MAERKTAGRHKKKTTEPVRIRIKKNDVVKVISGRDKGKTGRVLEVDSGTGRLLVEGVQMIKRHTRPNPAKQVKGGIAERESSIHASNVMVLTAGGVATRIGYKVEKEGGVTRRTRIARKTGEALK
jgi:large subunit ribosomal protein L24